MKSRALPSHNNPLDGAAIQDNVDRGEKMFGAIITFLAVCAIFGIYMSIVHRFLRAAEEPEDVAAEERVRASRKKNESDTAPSREPRWAH